MSERGIALILAVLVTTFLSALGIGLMLAVFMDRLANGNMAGSVAMLYAADAGIEFAARELAQAPTVDVVLNGAYRSTFTDGAPSGVRDLPGGGVVDLTAATNMLNCGKITTCTSAQMDANSNERPWGTNNPRWRLFAYGPMAQFTQLTRPADCYLAVWIGDDVREQDGNPQVDAVAADAPGHGIVRVHAETSGIAGSRRVIEAELARVCPADLAPACLPGIRVQSWQELRQVLP
ncbi:MAG: pilus assembly PilX N-terminal domain-containing protein [Acidobacteriota bacterium]